MGGSSGSQQTQSSQNTQPWAPTQPLLQNILGQLGGVNTSVTPYQQQALGQIQQNATQLPNFGPATTNAASSLLAGNPLAGAQGQLNQTLSPYTNQNFLNPGTNPYQSQLINTINQDVQNQVGSMWAGAGLTPNGGEAQAMARGLSQGLAPTLFNQFNQNAGLQQNAAGMNFNAANTANTANTANIGAGLGVAGQIPGMTNMAPLSQLQAASMAYNLPLAQLGGIEGMTLPIAGLGSQSQGTSNTNTQYNPSLLSQIGAGVNIAGGIFG